MQQKITLYFILFLIIAIAGCEQEITSPDSNIVAQFKGGQITRKAVEEQINKLIQGEDPKIVKQIQNKDIYASLIESMALDSMIEEKIKAKKLSSRENVKHAMKHVSEEININELHSRAHKNDIKIEETDLRSYYEENSEQFKDRPLLEVKDEIRNILLSEKETEYFRGYMEELKKNAVITREDSLLKVPQPSEADIRLKYEENRNKYGGPDKSFAEVKDQVWAELSKEMEEKWFKQNQNRTLFTIHGKRHTLGEFYQEFKELSPYEQEKYQDSKAMKQLMDKVIERILVVEDTYDQMLDTETREETTYVQEEILRELLHQEEVDDKLTINDEEVKAYYEDHKKEYVAPPEVQISYIRIGRGQTEDEKKGAEEKVKTAYKLLKPGFFKKSESFENVAREYSEDLETAQTGGKIDGWVFESNNIIEEISSHDFHKVIFSLPSGGVSRPFQFQGSWYIVTVRERREASLMPFENEKEHIRTELTEKKHEELTLSMSETLLEEANLIIYDDVIESMLNEN